MREYENRFWDQKIEGWERKRYEKARSPIARRAAYARDFLRQHAQGQRVLDLGCGSGQLFRELPAEEFKSLHGVDFSKTAIELAQAQNQAPNVTFNQQNAADVDVRSYDMVVALGLLDWLSDRQIALLLNRLSGRRFLLSFSNSAAWAPALLHSAFVHLTYGWKTSGYRPRYFHAQELLFHFDERTVKHVQITTLKGHSLVGFLVST